MHGPPDGELPPGATSSGPDGQAAAATLSLARVGPKSHPSRLDGSVTVVEGSSYVIVRVIRARIAPTREAEAFTILREVNAGSARPAGLVAIFVARRVSHDGDHMVAITVWTDVDAIEAALGRTWESPRFLPQLDPFLEDLSIEHFESIVDRYDELAAIGT